MLALFAERSLLYSPRHHIATLAYVERDDRLPVYSGRRDA